MTHSRARWWKPWTTNRMVGHLVGGCDHVLGVMWTRDVKAGLSRHNENLLLADGFSSSEANWTRLVGDDEG
ncbi:MAG: hypothetical protein U5O39_12060 [Gammaproteobacteria bacterium]|nr:hypothetical protein [Gammaproteobacteria bacterium]